MNALFVRGGYRMIERVLLPIYQKATYIWHALQFENVITLENKTAGF